MGRSVSGVLFAVVLVACLDTQAPKGVQIEVQPSSAALGEDESVAFSATVRNAGTIVPGAKVVWSIDNADLASIDSNGLATVRSVQVAGAAAVVATYAGVEAKATLSVSPGCVTKCGTWTMVNSAVPYWPAAGVGVIDGIIYIAGGRPGPSPGPGAKSNLRALNPANNVAVEKARMPTARKEAGVGVIDGKLYVVGGRDGDYQLLSVMEAYDPATDSWTTLAPLPTLRSTSNVAVLNGLLYVVGGFSQATVPAGLVTTVESYDPRTNMWTTRASLPKVASGVATVLDGVLYFVGVNGDIYTYDPQSDSWSTRAGTMSNFSSYTADRIGERIYFVDGTWHVYALDPVTNRWIRKASVDRSVSKLVTSTGALYALGGVIIPYDSITTLLRFTP